MRQGRKRMIACILAACMALGVAVAAIRPTTARADEAAVRAAGEGVFKFNWRYKGDIYSRGSCFLISDRYVLTCWHCAMFSRDEREAIETQLEKETGQELELDVRDFLDEFTYTVTVYRDMQKKAELVNYSEEEDWAIFKLESAVGDSTPLEIRDSKTVEAAETVWSVGFPADSDLKVVNTFRPDDVTIKKGTVSKPEGMYDNKIAGGWHYKGNYLQTSCPISGGDSGGPMVDDNGKVIGISAMGGDGSYFAIASDSIMIALDRLKIEYRPYPPDPSKKYSLTEDIESLQKTIDDAEAKAKQTETYTEDSIKALEEPLKAAKELAKLTLDDETSEKEYNDKSTKITKGNEALARAVKELEKTEASDEASGPEPSNNDWLHKPQVLAAIIAAAIAAIGAAVALIVALNRRKKRAASAPGTFEATGGVPFNQGAYQSPGGLGVAPVSPSGGAPNDRQVGAMAGEAVNGGTLTRLKTNERFAINRVETRLGRESSRVDICIEGNTNIGRVHALFVVRGNQTYIVDSHSKNGTFVNNVRAKAGVEQAIKDGDIIRMADEKFRFSK